MELLGVVMSTFIETNKEIINKLKEKYPEYKWKGITPVLMNEGFYGMGRNKQMRQLDNELFILPTDVQVFDLSQATEEEIRWWRKYISEDKGKKFGKIKDGFLIIDHYTFSKQSKEIKMRVKAKLKVLWGVDEKTKKPLSLKNSDTLIIKRQSKRKNDLLSKISRKHQGIDNLRKQREAMKEEKEKMIREIGEYLPIHLHD